MADVIIVGARELTDKLRELARAVSGDQLQQAMMQGGLLLEREMKNNIRSNHLIDTGNLRESVTAEPEGSDAVTVGPRNVVYAAIHEFGGTIRPRNAKYLAIPLSPKAKKAGSPKNYPGELQPMRLAGLQDRLFLVDVDRMQRARRSELSLAYILLRSVQMPARPYVRPALDQHGDDAIQAIADALTEFIEGVGE